MAKQRTDPATSSPTPSVAQHAPVSWSIFTLARAHRAVAASLLAPTGLAVGQELTLILLWDHDGLSQKDITASLGLDHSTVAKSLTRLARAGLVTRTRSDTDGRVTLVHLTDAGRALEAPVRQAWDDLETRTTARLSAQDRAQFEALTQTIVGSLDF